jgi:hypothetical protein
MKLNSLPRGVGVAHGTKGLLDQALLAVELLGAGMKRDRQTVHRLLEL